MTDRYTALGAAELFFYMASTVFFIGFGVSRIGQQIVGDCGNEFFDTLVQPAFFPPGWVFGVAWTLIYLSQSFAVWCVRRRARSRPVESWALVLFFVLQLVLSAYQATVSISLVAALVIVIASAVLAIVVTVLFFLVDYVPGLLMVPLVLWLAFATALQFAVNAIN